jgi:hypothetical protein
MAEVSCPLYMIQKEGSDEKNREKGDGSNGDLRLIRGAINEVEFRSKSLERHICGMSGRDIHRRMEDKAQIRSLERGGTSREICASKLLRSYVQGRGYLRKGGGRQVKEQLKFRRHR